MPADDARQTAARRLAADLRSHREARGLSDEDLREKLHMPPSLIEDFESGRLMEQSLFNRVYLRSLVRSYADAAEVPSAAALAGLGAALEGNYEEGQLDREIAAHQKREQEGAAEETTPDAAAAKEEHQQQEEEGGAAAATAAPHSPAEKEPDWSSQSPPSASLEEAQRRDREKEERARARAREREEQARRQKQRREQREQQQHEERQQQRQQQKQQREQQQREQQQREADRPARRSRRDRRSSSSAGRWVIGALLVAAVAAGVFFLVPSFGGGGSGTETAQSVAAAGDTAAGGGEQTAQQDQRPPADLQLGETMSFTVVAEGGAVRDLKVTRDQDVRRPYWIEAGQATVFPAQQRIIIQNPPEGEPTLQNVRLLAEGYPYPTDRRDEQGRIVITRQDMQSFADTLRGEPAQVPAQRDTASFTG